VVVVTRKYLDILFVPLYNHECCLEVIDMKWSINQLQKHSQRVLPFDEVVNLDSVKKRNPDIRSIDPVQVSGSCTIDHGKLTCRFSLDGKMVLPCSRTWVDIDYPFHIEATEQYSWDETVIEMEEEIHPAEGDYVDLYPALEELILLEVPLQIISENAKDLKKVDGKGWSFTTTEEYAAEQKAKVDPRLAGLANFFDKDE
jgi:uncharacterized protein